MLRKKTEGCMLVFKVNSNNKHVHYREFDLRELPIKENDWQAVKLMCKLPKIDVNNFEFSIYFWNPLKAEIYYDDLVVEVY